VGWRVRGIEDVKTVAELSSLMRAGELQPKVNNEEMQNLLDGGKFEDRKMVLILWMATRCVSLLLRESKLNKTYMGNE
jgi:hypothetical protein